jgi:hypothetical protein
LMWMQAVFMRCGLAERAVLMLSESDDLSWMMMAELLSGHVLSALSKWQHGVGGVPTLK